MLRFAIGNTNDLSEIGIETDGLRKSVDGTLSIIHIEFLSDEQFEAIRFNPSFTFKSGESMEELMKTPVWNDDEPTHDVNETPPN